MNKLVRPTLLLSSLLSMSVLGCELEQESPAPQDQPSPEAGPSVALTGMTIDYFAQEPVSEVALETLGLAPEQSSASDAEGRFLFSTVPTASLFFVRSSATTTHRPTISALDVGAEATERNVYVVSSSDVQRQHTTVGLSVTSDSTMVIVELSGPDGRPLADVGRENLVILDSTGAVIASDPYVFGALGDIDPSLANAEVHRGASRMAFLNVPAGMHQLSFSCASCEPAFETSQTLIAGAGVTLSHVSASFNPAPSTESFASVFPLFARGSEGGLGCASCHTAGGVPPVLDGDPNTVYQLLRQNPLLINVAVPDISRLLSKPLYELPANHPNASFLDTDDPSYQALREWIAAGAMP